MVLTAPKPGEGLKTIEISRESFPGMFDVFVDLAQTKFDFLDVEKDLTDVERGELESKGVLLPKENRPQLPLYECTLADVAGITGDIGPEKPVVNDSFRFEPFDLSKYASWARTKHISPAKPTAWIRSAITDIDLPYWLEQDEAEVLSQFVAGEPLKQDLDEKFLRKLIEAEILIRPGAFRQKCERLSGAIRTAKREFDSTKYTVIKNLLPPSHMRAMSRYYRQYVDHGFMVMGDPQVKRRYQQYNEPLAAFLQPQFKKLISELASEEVILSYVYAASYEEGAELQPHIDREQCEFSISFQVDYMPEPPDLISPWPLFVEPARLDGKLPKNGIIFGWDYIKNRENGEKTGIHLANGDGLIYRGRELVHYRYALPPGHRSTSLFFHFVRTSFNGGLE